MLKRYICIYATIIALTLVFSVFVRFSITDRQVYGASHIGDLNTIEFQFYNVFDENILPLKDDIKKELDNCQYILEVVPTGNIKVFGHNIMQEVTINHCIKGSIHTDDTIWISTSSGFTYNKDTDTVYNWGMHNIMHNDYSYIVILNTVTYNNNIYYYNDFSLGALRCSSEKDYSYIDISQKYTYLELEQCEFLALDKSTLKQMYDLKDYVMEYLSSIHNYNK